MSLIIRRAERRDKQSPEQEVEAGGEAVHDSVELRIIQGGASPRSSRRPVQYGARRRLRAVPEWGERLPSGHRRYQAVPIQLPSAGTTQLLCSELAGFRLHDVGVAQTQALTVPLCEVRPEDVEGV